MLPAGCRTLATTPRLLAGHNKWSKIKHTKAVLDKRRATAFQRVTRRIIAAVRRHGPEPSSNPILAACLADARRIQLPKDNLQSALRKAAGGGAKDGGALALDDVEYEVSALDGAVAAILECSTANRNRVIKHVREVVKSHGGSVGGVRYRFERRGVIRFALSEAVAASSFAGKSEDEIVDALMEMAIEAGAQDVARVHDVAEEDEAAATPNVTVELVCSPAGLQATRQGLPSTVDVLEMDVEYRPVDPASVVMLPDWQDVAEQARVRKFLEDLESVEDVVKVHSNVVDL